MIDYTLLRKLATEPHLPAIHSAYGSDGTIAFRWIMEFLTQLYERIEPELLPGTLVVYRQFENAGTSDLIQGTSRIYRSIEELAPAVRSGVVIEIRERGRFVLWVADDLDVAGLSAGALVYRITPEGESFVINGVDTRIENPNPLQVSLFSRPTFSELRYALQRYVRQIRVSNCGYFSQTWEDPKRLFFRSGPEELMRTSLHYFLSAGLRDVVVLQEQNVDASHPIDIKVEWQFMPRIALIEIKWLGKSRDAGRITADYGPARARAGARQLADYLDANRTSAPEHQTQGYLVVFDGRRRGLNASSQSVTRRNGFYYEFSEIEYDPKYHETRADFAEPIRIFVEPLCDPN